MLQTWTMQTPKITGLRERGGSPVEGGGAEVLRLLDEAGYVGTLATNSEFEIVRYLRLGDTVSAETLVESVSPEKQTRLGPGRFLTWVTTYRDGAGEMVGTQTFRILKFDPRGWRREHRPARAPRPDGHARHAVLLGRAARRGDCWSSAATAAACCATRRARCARTAGRWPGRRSSRRAGGGGERGAAAPPAVPVVRGRIRGRARGARRGRADRDEPRRRSGRRRRDRARGSRSGSPSSTATSCCRCSRRRRRHDASRPHVRVDRGRRRAHAARDRRDRERDRVRRDRVARLHAGAPRPRLRERAGRARHLHEHPLGHRLLQPVPHRLGRSRRDGPPHRDPPRRPGVPRATR